MIASLLTMYRVARAARMSRERRQQRPPWSHPKPMITFDGPDQALTWDISKLPTLDVGLYLNLYVILDLFSRSGLDDQPEGERRLGGAAVPGNHPPLGRRPRSVGSSIRTVDRQ